MMSKDNAIKNSEMGGAMHPDGSEDQLAPRQTAIPASAAPGEGGIRSSRRPV